LQLCQIFLYSRHVKPLLDVFYIVKSIVMKKLLTLTALIAGVALFAGCMDKPEVEEVVVEETPVVEEVVTEEVVTGDVVVEDATTTEVAPEATAE